MKHLDISRILNNFFPSFGVKNISLYYLFEMFNNGWFIVAIWLFFALEYVTAAQFGLIESVSFAIGLLLEIPSGAVADLLGKKRTVQVGVLMEFLGIIIFTLAFITPWSMFIGNAMIVAGFAFLSGASEALAYDSLVEKGLEDKYEIIAGRKGTITSIFFIFSSFVGGILWRFSKYLPWIAAAISFGIAFLATIKMTEPKVDTYSFSFKQFIKQTKDGFSQLKIPAIRPYLPMIILISATYYMWHSGIIRILMGESFGFGGEALSYLVGFVVILGTIFNFNFSKIRNFLGDSKGLFILALTTFLGWFLAGIGGGVLMGTLVFILITVSGDLNYPWRSSILNKHIPSQYRATTISTLQFLVQIPYVLVAVWFGWLFDKGWAGYFYIVVSLIVLFSILLGYLEKFRAKFKLYYYK